MKKNAALCIGNVLVKLTLKIHFIIWHLEQYIDEIFIILPAGRVCHFSLVMLPLYFVWQLFIWLCCWLLQQVAGWLKISELEKSVCFRVSNFSTYRSIWTHFGFYTSVLELTHYMYCVKVDQFLICVSLGKITTLVLCRQSPLNLHQFWLTRDAKYWPVGTDQNAICRYFALIRLCLALLFIMSIVSAAEKFFFWN